MARRQAGSQDEALPLILVVEDEPLIALDLAGTLEEGGFSVLGPAFTVSSALTLLDGQRPDAAVLDVNLGREVVTPVAHVLHRAHVPFLISSARSWDGLPEDAVLRRAPRLGKPTPAARLVASLREMLRMAASRSTGP